MTKKIKIALIASVLMGNFSYTYAGWFSFNTYDRATDAYSDGRYVDALLLYEKACTNEDFKSCNDAGAMHENGMGTVKDNLKAEYFYRIACNNRAGNGCNNLQSIDKEETRVREREKTIIKEQEANSKNFKQAQEYCQAGSADWCGRLGVHYYQGEGIDKNLNLAEKYLQQSCDAGHNKWCGWLGELSYGKKDYFKTFESYSKACNAGDAVGCRSIGYLYENGQGSRLDIAKAADFYGKACDMKDQAGCENYKRLKSPQPVQQANSNNSNTNYQQEQLRLQKEHYEAQERSDAINSLNQTLQNVSSKIRQNTYDTQQLTNQMQQRNDQLYQQNQGRKTNYQLQQINNNLNGIRYGY